MNVNTMTMPPEVAKEKLKAVRTKLHRRADDEYKALESAYAAAAKGLPLLSMGEVFRDCPVDERLRPKLGLARADRVQARVSAQRGFYHFESVARGQQFSWRGNSARFPDIDIAISSDRASGDMREGYALVPIVPPDVLGNRALDTHFILWEVEAWADSAIGARPDRDPYLLRRLGVDLFAVVAEWDLTDIERSVMAGRARS